MRSRIARTFVGREAELALLAESIATDPPAVPILLVHGPGGIGKTSWIERARALAASRGIDSVRLGARDVEPSVPGFARALAAAFGAPDAGTELAALLAHCARAPRRLLVIDDFDRLAHLQGWLRECFLAELPATTRVLIASRDVPDAVWRTDPLWREAARVCGLRNLGADECGHYLAARGIAPAHHDAIARLSHGHPLALTLVADLVAATGAVPERLLRDVIRQLAERFTAQAPTDRHRGALEVCAHARVTTQALLADTVDAHAAHDLFDWLASLGFIESGTTGLFPHELVRDSIDDELRWRHRERHREVHRAVRDHLLRQVRDKGPSARLALLDILFLHRKAEPMRPFVDFAALGNVYFEQGGASDLPSVLASLGGELPAAERAAFARWWSHRACSAWVVRPAARQVVAATLSIDLALLRDDELDGDPVMAAVWRRLQEVAPPRPGDRQLLARWSIATGGTSAASAAMNALQMAQFHQWLSLPDLGAFVICTDHPDRWLPMMRHIGFARMSGCDRVVGDVPLGCYVHDWRAVPVSSWLDVMGDRELGVERAMDDAGVGPAAARLSRTEFERMVRDALRVCNDKAALAASPLVASAMVSGGRRDAERPFETLRRLIVEAVRALGDRPRDAKFSRALELTYLRPAGSQELAAERLGVPFGTYRYQLATGIERVAQALWALETD